MYYMIYFLKMDDKSMDIIIRFACLKEMIKPQHLTYQFMQLIICFLEIDNKGINRAFKSFWFYFLILDNKSLNRIALGLMDRALRFAFLNKSSRSGSTLLLQMIQLRQNIKVYSWFDLIPYKIQGLFFGMINESLSRVLTISTS